MLDTDADPAAGAEGYDLERKSKSGTKADHLYWLHYRTLEPFIHTQLPALQTPLLDLGCGSKPYRELYPPGEVIGADVFAGQSVDVKLEAGKALPFADGQFRSVFSAQVLEHVYGVELFLREAFRVTEPGGNLLMTVPFVWELHEEPHDFLRFTKYWIEQKLREIGYSSVVIEPQGGDFAMIGQAILLVLARRSIVFPRPVLRVYNLFFDWLDRRSFSNHFPLNYGVIASKPVSNG